MPTDDAWVEYAAFTAQHTRREDAVWRLALRTGRDLSMLSIGVIPIDAAQDLYGKKITWSHWATHRRARDTKFDVALINLYMYTEVRATASFSVAEVPMEQRKRLMLKEGMPHTVIVEIEPAARVFRVRVDDYTVEGMIADDAGIGPDMPIVWGIGLHSPGGEVTLLPC
jgi:hypothetical protein